jgi:hypothetical protein
MSLLRAYRSVLSFPVILSKFYLRTNDRIANDTFLQLIISKLQMCQWQERRIYQLCMTVRKVGE